MAATLAEALERNLELFTAFSKMELYQHRVKRYRNAGNFFAH